MTVDNNALYRELGVISEKLDTLIEREGDHEKRLRSLEKRQWWTSGASAAVGAFFTMFLGKPH